MRINIFTAIPLGIYLHKVEMARKDGWDDTDEFIQGIAKEFYKSERECGKTMNKTKFGSLENCKASYKLLQTRGGDLGLDLMLFTMDACNFLDRYKSYIKNYPNSKK